MLKMIRKSGTLLLILLSAILMVSCGGHGKRIVIGVSQCSEDIWREKLNTEMQISAYMYDNVELRIVSADDDDSLQIRQINQFIDESVDLLIVAPNQVHAISSAIDRAHEEGIPVIEFDRKTDTDNYTAFLGADNYFIGQTMGRFIAQQLGGRGNVVELQGLRGSSPAIERHRGFVDGLAEYPQIALVDSRFTDWTGDSGKEAMDSVLTLRRDIDCVYGHNDRIALGAREAVSGAGIDRDIIYTGIDALPGADGGIQAVQEGVLAASYIYPTRGDLVIQLAMDILEGRAYERDNYLQSTMVTRDNVDAMLLQADEMVLQQDRLIRLHEQVNNYLLQYNHQKIYEILFAIIIILLLAFIFFVIRTYRTRRRMEQEATNAKLQFFTNVSHEFRTPLTLIADPVGRLLENGKLDREQRDLLSLVQKNVGVMLRLTNEILDFHKVQSGKMTVEASEFDLAESLRAWAGTFIPSAQKRGIELTLEVPGQLAARTDRNKMERIVYNLLSNAMKYTGDGGRITVSLTETAGAFSLTISDTGVGMPAETLSKVFDRFYQVRGSVRGTGIGLALVKDFAELLGGDVTVESKVGEGSTFIVTLPTRIEETDAEPKPEAAALTADVAAIKTDKVTDPEDAGEKPHVLIVDDNADVITYISSLLNADYEISTATDGKAGLDKAIREVPDLIISDVMMPVMDGLEMCNALKTTTATSHIPVILLTAKAEEDCRAEGYGRGADAYITKPFSSKVLLARVKNLLDNRRLLRDYFSSGDATEQNARPKDADTAFLDRLRDRMQEHLSDSEFNVEDLGAEMNLSRVQLYRKVKALTGSSPVELIRITRLKKARQLLQTRSMTVSEVCYEVGFSSPSYFTKCYRDYFGHTPTATE
ncbi:MAG: substrate-binding domain-containing protein [Clostridia bacterium]|nr:substrate-binding domain-containing protein [Clostridia bacterium]